MQFQDDPFGSLPSFGGGGYPGGPMAGDMPEGMFGAAKKKKKGLNPMMLFSPMGGLMMQDPKMAMSLLSPAFGIANMFGAFK